VALGESTQRGEHARKEAGLLDRIRTEENADELGEAWQYIERHQNSPIDGQRVIRAALHALTLSENAVRVPEGYHSSLRRLKGLITAVDQLQEYFCKDIKRDPPWKILAREADNIDEPDYRKATISLSRIREILKNRAETFGTAYNELGLSRETKTARARYVAFTAALSESMLKIFGKPLDRIVQILAHVALKGEVTIDQVKHARRSVAHRKGRTRARKI
jgi:hypothetical protein